MSGFRGVARATQHSAKRACPCRGSGWEVAPPWGGTQPPGRGWGSAAGQPGGLLGRSCRKLGSGGGCAWQRPGGGNVNELSVTELVRYTDLGDPAGGGTAGLGAGKALRDPKASAGSQGLSGTPKALQGPKASAGPQGLSRTLKLQRDPVLSLGSADRLQVRVPGDPHGSAGWVLVTSSLTASSL